MKPWEEVLLGLPLPLTPPMSPLLWSGLPLLPLLPLKPDAEGPAPQASGARSRERPLPPGCAHHLHAFRH